MNLTLLAWVGWGIGVLAALGWCGLHLVGALSLARVPRLRVARRPAAEPCPSLSIVVAACNEAKTLQAAIESLCKQDYPELEIILVNDRSTDGTSAIADRIAAEDRRVTALHVSALPAGWLGKTNALRRGFAAARGEYVLFADADVRFAPGALRAAMALVLDERLDHLTLLPRLESTSLWHAALMQAFFVGYVRRTAGRRDVAGGHRPFGYGAFNLVRRPAFEQTAGFEWFRMDVLDDLALGALMKGSGARSGFAVAPDLLAILWYPTVAEALRGFEKNAFGGLAGYRVARALGFAFGMAMLGLAPLFLLVPGVAAELWPVAIAALACLFGEATVGRARFGLRLVPGLLSPATHLLMAYAMVRAGLGCRKQGGILWRGTLYPLEELRAGRRVSFP